MFQQSPFQHNQQRPNSNRQQRPNMFGNRQQFYHGNGLQYPQGSQPQQPAFGQNQMNSNQQMNMFQQNPRMMQNQPMIYPNQPTNQQKPTSGQEKKKGFGGLVSNLLQKNQQKKDQKQPTKNMMPQTNYGPINTPSAMNNNMQRNSMFNQETPFFNDSTMAPKMMQRPAEEKKSSGLGAIKDMILGNSNDRSATSSSPSLTSILTNPNSLQQIMGNVNNIAGATGNLMPVVDQYLPFVKKIPSWVSNLGSKDQNTITKTIDNAKESTKVTVTNTKDTPKSTSTPRKSTPNGMKTQKAGPLPSIPKIYTSKPK